MLNPKEIDIINSEGEFVANDAFVQNAWRQPVFFQLYDIKTCTKSLFTAEYTTADLKQTRETCPFNIYGRIIFK